MTVTDELLADNADYAAGFTGPRPLPLPPAEHLAVVACMDARWTSTASSGCTSASPFIPHRDSVRGFVVDVATGKLDEVV